MLMGVEPCPGKLRGEPLTVVPPTETAYGTSSISLYYPRKHSLFMSVWERHMSSFHCGGKPGSPWKCISRRVERAKHDKREGTVAAAVAVRAREEDLFV